MNDFDEKLDRLITRVVGISIIILMPAACIGIICIMVFLIFGGLK